jgi:hypothetical protein
MVDLSLTPSPASCYTSSKSFWPGDKNLNSRHNTHSLGSRHRCALDKNHDKTYQSHPSQETPWTTVHHYQTVPLAGMRIPP